MNQIELIKKNGLPAWLNSCGKTPHAIAKAIGTPRRSLYHWKDNKPSKTSLRLFLIDLERAIDNGLIEFK